MSGKPSLKALRESRKAAGDVVVSAQGPLRPDDPAITLKALMVFRASETIALAEFVSPLERDHLVALRNAAPALLAIAEAARRWREAAEQIPSIPLGDASAAAWAKLNEAAVALRAALALMEE